MRQVDFQDGDGRAPNRSDPHKTRAIPLEMLLPLMPTWMEKPNDSPSARITPSDIRPLVVVTEETRQRQISRSRWAIVFAGNDVVYLKGKIVVFLRRLAIFAGIPGATPNQTFQAKIHSGI